MAQDAERSPVMAEIVSARVRSLSLLLLSLIFLVVGLVYVATLDAANGVAADMPILEFIQDYNDTDGGMDGPVAIAVSPDGANVYVTGYHDDAVVVFARETNGEISSLRQVIRDTDVGIDGLHWPQGVAVSPDGRHVYVAGMGDNAVAAFSRDGSTGELTFVETEQQGVVGVDGLLYPVHVAVSPDGDHVYVASQASGAVAVFDRDDTSGELDFVEKLANGDGTPAVTGMDGACAVAVSDDGNHVYVAANGDNALVAFSRDKGTGELSFVEAEWDDVGGVDGLAYATSVAISPGGSHVYVTSRDDAAIAVFARNGSTGELSFVNAVKDADPGVDGLALAWSMSVSPDGSHVYVASPGDHALAVFSRNGTTGELTSVGMEQDGVGVVDGLLNAGYVTLDPGGNHVYAAGYLDDAVAVFGRDGTTGELTFLEAQRVTDGLDNARSVVVSPDGGHVYVAGRDDDAVAMFERSAGDGTLSFFGQQRQGLDSVDGLDGANGLAVSPDGEHVYAASINGDAVVTFDRDPSSGDLSFRQVISDGMPSVDGLNGASSVVVSPDGAHVYVTGAGADAIVRLYRDGVTGDLTFADAVYDGDDHGGLIVDGLTDAYSVAISPDGWHVYVAGAGDSAVAVFVRNDLTGVLTFVQVVKDADPGIDGLQTARSVTVSQDGAHVYVAGTADDAVAVFSRSPTGGELTFVHAVKDENQGGTADGLDGARSVVVSADGAYVFVAGSAEQAMAVFTRDETTGELTFAEVHRNFYSNVRGLDGATSIAVSGDGKHVYVAGFTDDAVVVFGYRFWVFLPLVLRGF
jgi:6-phosphogluconolactonase (cycloisomerase 2 family)